MISLVGPWVVSALGGIILGATLGPVVSRWWRPRAPSIDDLAIGQWDGRWNAHKRMVAGICAEYRRFLEEEREEPDDV